MRIRVRVPVFDPDLMFVSDSVTVSVKVCDFEALIAQCGQRTVLDSVKDTLSVCVRLVVTETVANSVTD